MKYNKVSMLVLFLVSFGMLAQEINQVNENGERMGDWKKHYPNKRLRYEGTFLDGKEIGVFKFYSMNASLHPVAIKTFSEKPNKAKVQFFTNKGVMESEGMMVGKLRVGNWLYFHKDGKTIMIEENYVDGLLSGEYKLYYKDTILTRLAHYVAGELHGSYKQYSDKGILTDDLTYKEGYIDGKAVFYEPNGKIKQRGKYKKDLKVGIWEYYVEGKLVTTKDIDELKEKEE
jgi:antitoxin component YwqK of YwqJK toxin-antitoxin module